jgi:hypothetical protein
MKAIIFDLGNCLSAADEVGPELLEPTFAAIRRANKGASSDEALEERAGDVTETTTQKIIIRAPGVRGTIRPGDIPSAVTVHRHRQVLPVRLG